jgi:hypothetical protein
MEKNRQHFVPRFYLKRFASDANASEPKLIHIYNFASGRTILNVSLRKQCYKHRYYGKTDDVENALSDLEGAASGILRQIITDLKLPNTETPEYVVLLLFVVVQLLRAPGTVERMMTGVDKMFKQAIRHDPRADGLDLDSARVTSSDPAITSLGMAEPMLWAFSDLRMHLVCAGQNQFFLSSDLPVARYNQLYENIPGVGQLGGDCRGLQIFFPLSPKCLLMLYDSSVYAVGDGRASITYNLPDTDIYALNLLQAVSMSKNLYYSDSNVSEQVRLIAEKATGYRVDDPMSVEEYPEVGKENMSSLIVAHEIAPNLNLRLSFVRVFNSVRKLSRKDRLEPKFRYRKRFPDSAPQPPNTVPIRRVFRQSDIKKT